MTTVNGEYFPDPSPKPHPRVKPEAESYAERNRGNMERWFDYSGDDGYNSPRPVGRAVTDEGRRNANTNKGCMSDIMGGYADPVPQRTIHPRAVTGEASDIAQQSQGGAMKNLIDNYGNMSVEARHGPKVHGYEAEEYAERNHGTVNKLMDNYGNLTPDHPPPQKLGLGGDVVAERHNGAGMGPLLRMEGQRTQQEGKTGVLHQESQGAGRPQSSPYRTRPEAMTNYQKNQASEMSAIMHGQSSANTPARRNNRMMMKSED
ncbi:hypothetical protein MAR_013132, partial [Mya arenaria]